MPWRGASRAWLEGVRVGSQPLKLFHDFGCSGALRAISLCRPSRACFDRVRHCHHQLRACVTQTFLHESRVWLPFFHSAASSSLHATLLHVLLFYFVPPNPVDNFLCPLFIPHPTHQHTLSSFILLHLLFFSKCLRHPPSSPLPPFPSRILNPCPHFPSPRVVFPLLL